MSEPNIRQFTASDGYVLNYRHWDASLQKPKGYIVALHGIQSHSGWYGYSSERVSQAGFQIDFMDRRGSGLNEPPRGDAAHQDRLINDVLQFAQSINHERNQIDHTRPLILLAVSWGGKLAAVTASRRPELFDAVALLYPGLCAKVRATPLQQFRLNLAEKLDIRDRLIPIPLNDPALFTGEAEWQKFIRDDQLKIDDVTVSFLLANREIDRLLADVPSRIRCPLLCVLAGNDQIIDNQRTRQFLSRLETSQQTVVEYPKAQHTLEFELDRDQFIDDLIAWLDSVADQNTPELKSEG